MTVRIRIEAETDLEAIFDWYESRSRGLGPKFLDELLNGIRTVAQTPNRWPLHPVVGGIRRYRLAPFPFSLANRVESDHCMIFAVEDLRQRPGYWRDRLKEKS